VTVPLPPDPRPRGGRRASGLAGLAFALALLAPMTARPSAAAELDGVSMPELLQQAGKPLRLNGLGLRTYSVFSVHIYVAGLYLEQPSGDAESILHSDATKLLVIHFVHDVDAERAREAWVTGFRENCRAPCRLPGHDLERFLAAVPSFRRGDESTLLFTGHAVEVAVNGQVLGSIADPDFARTILATFIGPIPSTEPLKRGLLGRPD